MVTALVLHIGINFWPSFIPVLPIGEAALRALVAMLVLVALGLLAQPKVAASGDMVP